MFGTALDDALHAVDWSIATLLILAVLAFGLGSAMSIMGRRRSLRALVALAKASPGEQAPPVRIEVAAGAANSTTGLGPLVMGSAGALIVTIGATFMLVDDPSMSGSDGVLYGTPIAELPALALPLMGPGVVAMAAAIIWGAVVLARSLEERNVVIARWPVWASDH